MKPNDGGPAFARPIGATGEGDWSAPQKGMSLRDYFAAHALQGELASQTQGQEWGESTYAVLARMMYQIADAMIAARRNHHEP